MKQIGARQEAGRIGGIGSCGRELCCSTWLTDFRSVTTSAARYQQLALNPQKLAGQCGKLKCCLNYELDMYIEAVKSYPLAERQAEDQAGYRLPPEDRHLHGDDVVPVQDSPEAIRPWRASHRRRCARSSSRTNRASSRT